MPVERFEDLRVWQKAKELAVAVYRVSGTGGFHQDWGLRDQIRRAAVSVMSNIAEGFDRYGRGEFRHFLSIARGSASEVRSQLYLARELDYVSESEFGELHRQCTEVSRMLGGLRSRLPITAG
jgi:four helix bundle protein